MPIPNSILGNMMPVGLRDALEVYPSKATLRPITKTITSAGQETHTFADSTDPTQQNLACRKSPLIQIRPQSQEAEFGAGIQRTDAKFQVNFASFINVQEITLNTWQVKIDGAIYQIRSVESDGSKLTTRLMISDEVPFVA